MNVLCVSFGASWFQQKHENGETAWYNTTGITRSQSSRHVLRLWTFPGIVRFNANSFPWASSPNDLAGVLCLAPGLEKAKSGAARLLCDRPLKLSSSVDSYLVSVHSTDIGFIDRSQVWRSKNVKLIAASRHRDGRQELLLLIQRDAWIKTSFGLWDLSVRLNRHHKPILVRSPLETETIERNV